MSKDIVQLEGKKIKKIYFLSGDPSYICITLSDGSELKINRNVLFDKDGNFYNDDKVPEVKE